MQTFVATSLTLALLSAGCVLATSGYRSYRMFLESHGSSDHPVHLERTGKFSLVANPPGRSWFRPGGVLEIRLADSGQAELDYFISGRGKVRVTDRSGTVCLDQALEDLGVGSSARGRFLVFPREFDTSRGGPYRIQFEISEAFTALAGIHQILSVHHFVCGSEAIYHLAQFGGVLCCSLRAGFSRANGC